ncbi:MAG: hypothetical protein HS115_05015 [Spirochaetales bacterium]|nr:hypothetical protein [Spirochaetales bacterium]
MFDHHRAVKSAWLPRLLLLPGALLWGCLAPALKLEPGRAAHCRYLDLYLEQVCDDEHSFFQKVKDQYKHVEWSDFLKDGVLRPDKEHSVDALSALFFLRSVESPQQRNFRKQIREYEQNFQAALPLVQDGPLLAFVPGMFYRDNPHSGADGRTLRNLAQEMGLRETLIAVEQTGSVEQNATIICDFLADRQEKVILASVSKGGADVQAAWSLCGNKPFMKNVVAWLNVGGLLRGTQLVNYHEDRLLSRWLTRLEFYRSGYDYAGFLSLRRPPTPPQRKIPAHVRVISVVAAPLERYVSARSRAYYRILKDYGPNDGLTLAADAMVPGALTYVSYRNDHYFGLDMPAARIAAMLAYLVQDTG